MKAICKLLFLMMLVCWSCQNDDNADNDMESYSTIEAYIVGYNTLSGIKTNENGTAKAGMYLLISENLQDTLAAKDLPDLFAFPAEIVYKTVHYVFNYFPQEYRFTYKVQLTYRVMTREEEGEHGVYYPTFAYDIYLFQVYPKYIIIKSIKKI